MKTVYMRTKATKILAGIAVIIFMFCAVFSIVMIVKQDHVFLILMFHLVLLGLLFAICAWIERKGTLELDDDGILFNYRVFSRSRELNRKKVFLRYKDIHRIQRVFYGGDGLVAKDTIMYKFILTDNREVNAYLYHFGKTAEDEIVSILSKKISDE